MKEATGELNGTVVVAISIGVLATFFFTVIWPMLKENFQVNSDCNKATCDCSAKTRKSHKGYCVCNIKDGKKDFLCIYKG